ncbi:TonB-dependent siderophore receptor [Xanthomonas indica]|uniref:TonB-dependent receptor plug domain-containing protein n=1 Tax=Xanthomonas indica TaxID=2912242 RepID=A0AAU8I2A3_9XANT|nr:TonB-dependent receptor plug domain-containing protein [Xanthomonas indica]MCI2260835.1 TonB-dependent receptor plug domain-containing protein [Xanthomonas indica]
MCSLTDVGGLQRQIGQRAPRPPAHEHTPSPRSLLGSALAAAIAVSTHGACAAEPAQRPNEAGENASNAAQSLPAVNVTHRADAAATEGTGSYTTGETAAATRLPLSLRDTPQSVTVITRQRMDDQQLTSVQGVLENTTGIASYQSDSERTSFYSRGFLINNLQYDGIPTVVGNIVNGSGIGSLDTAFYDRVEVVRGASGLLTGTGNPSAAINLVRNVRPRNSPRPPRWARGAGTPTGEWPTSPRR